MRNWALLLALFGSALSASAAKGISVADLERTLNADRGKPDAQIAQQLSDFQLTERLSAATLARLQSLSPGPQTTQELKILADQSEFLPLPPAELPLLPAPDFAEQRKIMALVVNYVSKTIHVLPNFSATRVTTSFEETPLIQRPICYVLLPLLILVPLQIRNTRNERDLLHEKFSRHFEEYRQFTWF